MSSKSKVDEPLKNPSDPDCKLQKNPAGYSDQSIAIQIDTVIFTELQPNTRGFLNLGARQRRAE
jgi:hypothetical protein